MRGQWDEEQAQLQRQAENVRKQLGIDAELRRFGQATLTGSAALHVMVARDIDLTVAVPQLNGELLGRAVAFGARLSARPDVREVTFRNDTGRWNTDTSYPDGLYFRVECVDSEDIRWSLDIWFVDEPEKQPDLLHLESIGPRITPESQEVILAIKRHTLGYRSDGSQLPSYEIYEAVLNHDVTTPTQFEQREL